MTPARIFSLLIAITLLLLQSSISANSDDLRKLQQNIKELQFDINKKKQQQQNTEQELASLEKNISLILKSLKENSNMQQTLQSNLDALSNTKQQQLINLRKQQHNIRQLLVQQYKQGESSELKLLLNQNNPDEVDRNLIYNQYLNRHHKQHINTIQNELNKLNTTEQQINEQQQQLATAKEQHSKQQTTLEQQRQQRQTLLAELASELKTKDQQLADLLEDEKRLQTTVKNIQQRRPPEKTNTPSKRPQNLAKLKGKLPWPIKGKVRRSFGSQKGTGALKWQGIVVGSQPEEDVYSVAAGKVVFADWLRGFGMLIIIDHGHGYITLYGQNETLFKDVGDLVEQQEVIASVGEDQDNSLYFELRHKGKPINPVPWLKR